MKLIKTLLQCTAEGGARYLPWRPYRLAQDSTLLTGKADRQLWGMRPYFMSYGIGLRAIARRAV